MQAMGISKILVVMTLAEVIAKASAGGINAGCWKELSGDCKDGCPLPGLAKGFSSIGGWWDLDWMIRALAG